MPELEEFDVKSPSEDPEQSRSVTPMVVGALVIIALIGFGVYWFGGETPEEEAPAPRVAEVETPPPRTVSPPEPIDPEPTEPLTLNDSDAFIRDLVAALSSHPGLAAWLVDDGLIRRFVVSIDNIAEGQNPAQHVSFMKPEQRFAVSGVEPSMRVDPRSYRRYDTHAQIVDSLDTAGVAELYLRLEPLMDDAYRELGYPDTKFRRTLERAMTHLLDVPVVDEPPLVALGAAFYEYTDERLDSLTPVQKQFFGMGGDNVRTIQTKIRAIASALGLSLS